VAEALRAAGCPIIPSLAITAGNLLVQAEQCGGVMRSSASGIGQALTRRW
jgi:hypothetical protein